MNTDNTLLNAVIGAVATFVLSFVPFSPILGGAVAAYLEGGDTGDGVRVGALSGAIAALPALGVLFLLFAFLPFAPDVGVAAVGVAVIVFIFVVALGYFVALSALGGLIGEYVRSDADGSERSSGGSEQLSGGSEQSPPADREFETTTGKRNEP